MRHDTVSAFYARHNRPLVINPRDLVSERDCDEHARIMRQRRIARRYREAVRDAQAFGQSIIARELLATIMPR